MERRDFLRIISAASIAPGAIVSAAGGDIAATVLYDDKAVPLARVGNGPKSAKDAL